MKNIQQKIAKLLIITLVATSFCGCEKTGGDKKPDGHTGSKDFGRVEGVLSAEDTIVGDDRLCIDLSDAPLELAADCTIEAVDVPDIEGVPVDAYDFSIDTEEELFAVMDIRIPYDAHRLGKEDPEGSVGAAYFNEETCEWEPVAFDINDDETITIHTEHLSIYGSFVVTEQNTREALASYVAPSSYFESTEFSFDPNAVIKEAVQLECVGKEGINAGLSVVGDALTYGAAGVDTISYYFNIMIGPTGGTVSMAKANVLFDGISDHVGQLGLAVSALQVTKDIYDIYVYGQEKEITCYTDIFKGYMGVLGPTVGGKLYSLAYLGVLAVDYSINQYANEAIKTRKDIYSKAYSIYYDENPRTAKEWANLFLKARKTARNPYYYDIRVEALIDRYVNEFWRLDYSTILYYQSEAQNSGFTGGGGLTDQMKDEIATEYKNKLMCTTVQDAFKMIAKRDYVIAQKEARKEMERVKEDLNAMCEIQVIDSYVSIAGRDDYESLYCGKRVMLDLPDHITDKDKWSVVLDDKGTGDISFTKLAYLSAGCPTDLLIYGEDDELEKTVSFEWKSDIQIVDLGVAQGISINDLIGEYQYRHVVGGEVVNDSIKTFSMTEDMRLNLLGVSTEQIEQSDYDDRTGELTFIVNSANDGLFDNQVKEEYNITFYKESEQIKFEGTLKLYRDGELLRESKVEGQKR